MNKETLWAQPGHLTNRAARLFVRLGESRMKALGVSAGQLPVFSALREGAALSQKELTQIVQIEQPTMAQTLSRMERDGLVQRQPDPNDGRSVLFSLTPSAMEKIPLMAELLALGNTEALADFNDEEKETLVKLLQKLIFGLEAATGKKESH